MLIIIIVVVVVVVIIIIPRFFLPFLASLQVLLMMFGRLTGERLMKQNQVLINTLSVG